MEIIKKIAVYLFIFLLFLLFIWAAFFPKEDFSKKVEETLQEQKHKADLFFKGMSFSETENGIKYWEFHSMTSDINKDTKLATMHDVDGLFYKGSKPTLKIVAPQAEWKMDKKEIYLYEPIGYDIKHESKLINHIKELEKTPQIFSLFNLSSNYQAESELGYWFKAHNLNWSFAEKMIVCDKGITLTKGDVVVFSQKLKGDVGLEKVNLTGSPKAMIFGRDGRNLTIEATTLDIDSPNDMVYAKGNVRLKRGNATITCDSASYNQREGIVTLFKNVYMVFEDIKAWGEKGSYSVQNESALLTGNAKALRGKSTLLGDRVTIFIKDGRIAVEGKTKIRIGEEELPKTK